MKEKNRREKADAQAGLTSLPIIGFYHENEEYGCFSNWYPAVFKYGRETYAHTEQYMMYQKVLMFRKYELADQIMKTTDPYKCKKIAGQRFPEYDDYLWEKTCYHIVKRGVYAKFKQTPEILRILLNTGNAILAECSERDKKWGIGIDISDEKRFDVTQWNGKNYLGRILMEVRDELRREVRSTPGNGLVFVDALDLEPIPEWRMTAGALKRIPQFYQAIHAYSDTLHDDYERSCFYASALADCEEAMRTNMGGGLPVIGFYEMKQDIYDIARRIDG